MSHANACTVGISLNSVGSLFQRCLARRKNEFVVICFWVGNKEFVVSCVMYFAKHYKTGFISACLWHRLSSDFEHTLRLTFEQF